MKQLRKLWDKIAPGQRLFEPDGISGRRNFFFFLGLIAIGAACLAVIDITSTKNTENILWVISFIPLIFGGIILPAIGTVGAAFSFMPMLRTFFPYKVAGVGYAFTHAKVNFDGTMSISNSKGRVYSVRFFLRKSGAEKFIKEKNYRTMRTDKNGKTAYIWCGWD